MGTSLRRVWLSLIVILLLWVSPAWAAIVLEQFTNDAGTGITSLTSTAWTPVANRFTLIEVYSVAGSGTPAQPTMSTTTGLSLVLVNEATSSVARITVYRAMKSSGLSSGTVTANFGGQTQDRIFISQIEFSGTDTAGSDGSGALVQSVVADSGGNPVSSIGGTLTAFGSVNNVGVFGATWRNASGLTTFTASTSWTEILDNVTGSTDGSHGAVNSTGATPAFSSTSDGATGVAAIVAVEVKAAGGVATQTNLLGTTTITGTTGVK